MEKRETIEDYLKRGGKVKRCPPGDCLPEHWRPETRERALNIQGPLKIQGDESGRVQPRGGQFAGW